MPNTFVGLVIFLVLLAPGFTFILVRERGLTAIRTSSTLRETATIGLASVVFDLVALLIGVAVAASTTWPAPSLRHLVTDGRGYLADAFVPTTAWFLSTLALACLFAAATGGIYNRTHQFGFLRKHPPGSWLFPRDGGNQQVSGWWTVLTDREVHPDKVRLVTCYFEDGGSVRGRLYRSNGDATEGPDRDLVLSAPLRIVDKEGAHREVSVGSAIVSAGRMLFMHVAYIDADKPAAK